MDKEKIAAGVRMILDGIGENPGREGLKGTPDRVARACEEIFGGTDEAVEEALSVNFEYSGSDFVMVKDIPFYSMCEHHLLPFYGKVHIAYLTDYLSGEIGLSKLARIVEAYARRPQRQERLTSQVAEAVASRFQNCMVVIQAEHTCMTMRGVQKPGSQTVTDVKKGIFNRETYLPQRVFSMIDF